MSDCKIKYSEELLQLLIDGVKPALGCTEPVAVGLAVAKAYEDIKGEILNIDVKVTSNIFKNGMGVGIPGTKEIGLVFASALGATCGDASLGLEVFRPVNDDSIEKAERLIENNLVKVDVEHNEGKFYIKAEVETNLGKGICIIRNSHMNIVYVESNGKILFEKDEKIKFNKSSNEFLKELKIVDIRNFVENIDFKNIEFLLEGVEVNKRIAEVGIKEKPGPGLGAAYHKMIEDGTMQKDAVNEARMIASAACDARMAGINMPVMSSGGSGNQGITAIIPTAVACRYENCDDEKLARTLAYSHIMTAYIKIFTGNLSPVCGCAIAAGIGSSSAITWMLGGDDEQIGGAIKNMVGTLSGMVCDGAKGGCAFKIATASSEAIIQANMAMNGIVINDSDGIISPNIEQTIRNLGDFCNGGMESADEEIIKIMLRN